jgi:hypothetical protein
MSWKPNPVQNTDATDEKNIVENRAYNQRRDDDNLKNFSVTLLDVDQVVFDHLSKRIAPQVTENGGQAVKVPIIYGSPERWKSIRQDGFLRDKKGKIQIPLMMYKRNSVSRNDSFVTLNRYLQHPFLKKYSVKNQYDRFTLINDMFPVEEIYNVTLPDHVVVSYDCMVWTEYVEQNNSIVEAVNFSEDDYWGDKRRYKFRAKIENYTHALELPADGDRMVRSSFTINIYAYLLPEMSDNKATTQKALTIRKVVWNMEINTNLVDTVSVKRKKCPRETFIESVPSISGGGAGGGVSFAEVMSFLSVNKTALGTWQSSDDGFGNSVVTFFGIKLLPTPAALVDSIDDSDKFMIYINGQHMIKSAIMFQQVGADFVVKMNNAIAGFKLESDDEIIAIGKFE